tara:strand:- start:711 stop:1874 length:1164 start_codon:yes stop_codon:yes gene_type:complete
MATTYKTFSNNDIVSTKTLLNEAIPLTGTVISGTYMEGTSEVNIKNYAHGMFQSVYDYPYLSSSANHIFDITMGYSANSDLSASTSTQNAKKINIYNQMAKVLVGHSSSGVIQEFDEDGDLTGGTKLRECFFINMARLLTKDEIKKGSFSLELGVAPGLSASFHRRIKLTDYNAQNDYRVNSPAGDYAVLYAETSYDGDGTGTFVHGPGTSGGTERVKAGLLYYQAGVAVLTASVFDHHSASSDGSTAGGGGILGDDIAASASVHMGPEIGQLFYVNQMLTGSEISSSCTALRSRMYNMSFNNTTELNSTIYFCRLNHNEFNYSSNPTYLNSSKIRVKNVAGDTPVAYVTGVGLYSSDNELMAVAKLSEPLKKDPTNELTLRVRLDY